VLFDFSATLQQGILRGQFFIRVAWQKLFQVLIVLAFS
jgi:hypothetical protein